MFVDFLPKHGICHRRCATEVHWQNSRAERHGGILQVMLTKMDHEEGINTYPNLTLALAQATMTKNQWSRHRGFAPELLVYKKTARVPGSVVSDENRSSHEMPLQDRPEGQRFRDELATRERARKAFAIVDNHQALRRALVSRSRPHRGHVQGERVMRWSKKGEADGIWSGPLQVVIQEGQGVVWLSQGTKLFRVAPEHLRPLSAVEELNGNRKANRNQCRPVLIRANQSCLHVAVYSFTINQSPRKYPFPVPTYLRTLHHQRKFHNPITPMHQVNIVKISPIKNQMEVTWVPRPFLVVAFHQGHQFQVRPHQTPWRQLSTIQ